MTKKNSIPKKMKYKYIFKDEYNPVYVNGAHGGISTRGEIIINFFLERHGVPYSQTHKIEDDGLLGAEIEREPKDYSAKMIRYVENGIVLNYQTAVQIRDFLDRQIKDLESLQNK